MRRNNEKIVRRDRVQRPQSIAMQLRRVCIEKRIDGNRDESYAHLNTQCKTAQSNIPTSEAIVTSSELAMR